MAPSAIIIGAGLGGSLLAHFLGQRGAVQFGKIGRVLGEQGYPVAGHVDEAAAHEDAGAGRPTPCRIDVDDGRTQGGDERHVAGHHRHVAFGAGHHHRFHVRRHQQAVGGDQFER